MIRLVKVSKRFHRGQTQVAALDGVSFHVKQGEFVSIMGPSGSGKSTLLHMMGGMDLPSSGEVFINGQPLKDMNDDQLSQLRRRSIGFIFQLFNLLPTLTAEENIALPLLLEGKKMNAARQEVAGLLELVKLKDRGRHRPDELSGGEMQRVAIARALATRPVILLADEPTGNLDSVTGQEILHLLKQCQENLRQTIVMVTHDSRAAAYGDRIITLRDGRLVEGQEEGNRLVTLV